MVELSGEIRRLKIEITIYPAVHLSVFASGQFAADKLIHITTTKPLRRRPDQTIHRFLQMSGDVHSNPGPATNYPRPVCNRNITSRGVSYQCNRCSGWVNAKCSGLLNVQLSIRDVVTGHATLVRYHHKYLHHLLPVVVVVGSTEKWWRGLTTVSTHTDRWYPPTTNRNPDPLVDWWPPSIQPAGAPPPREPSTNP